MNDHGGGEPAEARPAQVRESLSLGCAAHDIQALDTKVPVANDIAGSLVKSANSQEVLAWAGGDGARRFGLMEHFLPVQPRADFTALDLESERVWARLQLDGTVKLVVSPCARSRQNLPAWNCV